MSSTEDLALKFLAGKPYIFKDICLIYSPLLGEIATVGLEKFYQNLSVFSIQKPDLKESSEDGEANELNELLKNLSDFQYVLLLSQIDSTQSSLIKSAFEFFTHEKVSILLNPPSIVFGDASEKRILTEDDYESFCYYIKYACASIDASEDDIRIFADDSPKVKELKRQLLKGRKQREKAKKKKGEDTGNLKFSDLVASFAISSNSISILNIWDMTYYAFQDQLKRSSWKEEFDINTRAAMAGAKIDKKKLAHWIKTITFK